MGVEPGHPSCELKCSAGLVDLDTFDCPDQCKELCAAVLPNKLIDSFKYVKGITQGDRAVIAKYPKDALKVYMAKEKVDKLTEKVFGKAGQNDESDAFRHFVWSALLTKELGEKKARIFLSAHEQDPGQPEQEKSMDLSNNEEGVQFAVQKKEKGQDWEIDSVEAEALERLRGKKLKVLTPSGKKVPGGYYSQPKK